MTDDDRAAGHAGSVHSDPVSSSSGGALSPAELRRAIALEPDIVSVFDFDGTNLFHNPAFYRMIGSVADSRTSLGSHITAESREVFQAARQRLLAGEEIVGEELGLVMADGTEKWVSWIAQADHQHKRIYSIAREITSKRRLVDALDRSEQQLCTLINRAPDCFVVAAEGRLIFANLSASSLIGEALIGRTLRDLVHPDDRATFEKLERELTHEAHTPVEMRFLCSDERVAHVEVTAVRVDFEAAPATLYIARDLTERKRLEQQLLQADRMAQVGTLAAGVAHEINNPLAYVIANLTFLADELPAMVRELAARRAGQELPAELRSRKDNLDDIEQTLADAREGADRVRLIVQELRTFSRPSDDANEAIDLRDVLDSTCNIAWNEIRHRARLIKSYGEVPLVYANASRLGQVFLNLLVNAAHAITPGQPNKNEIRVTAQADESGRAIVEVHDTGCGIPREAIRRIFDPFYTRKPVGVGTGLGLSICLSIVRGLGGEITVDSEVDRGSVFRVRLPGHKLVSGRPASIEPNSGEIRPARARVLIVDDEPSVASALRRALGREHEVTVAPTAEEALKLLTTEEFDVVLCDVLMPQLSGLDLHDIVTRERPPLAERFLFMSGGVDGTTRTRLQATGRDAIDKPFSLNDLRALVARLLEQKPPVS